MGGKGNGKQQWRNQNRWQPQGMGSVIGNLQNALRDLQSFSVLANLASRIHPQPTMAPMTTTTGNPQADLPDLMQTMSNAILPTAGATPGLLTTSPQLDHVTMPEMKRLRRDLDQLTNRVDSQSDQISKIQQSTAASQQDAKDTKVMMERFISRLDQSPSNHHAAAPTTPLAPATTPNTPGRTATLSDPLQAQSPPQSVTPMAPDVIDKDARQIICQFVNTGPDNAKVQPIFDAIDDDNGMPFVEWWRRIAALRSIEQWQQKLQQDTKDTKVMMEC